MIFDLGESAQPRAGFVLPTVGATITALAPHRLPCCGLVPGLGDVVPQGTTGIVTEVRPPGVSCRGYVGACVVWDDVSVRRRYPAGVVIRWDVVDDPECFAFTDPAIP